MAPVVSPGPAGRKAIFAVVLLSSALTLVLAFTAPDPFFLAPFRESQTAISADYLRREPAGGMLAYQLPVLGVPWRIPLEFPLFQQLTAWLAASGLGVAQAGRWLNLFGFVACVWVAKRLWDSWGFPPEWRGLALAFLITSPLYAIYATSHMIESLALLLALLHLWGASQLARGGRWPWLLLAMPAGALAAMVKITTWLPAGGLIAFLALGQFLRAKARGDLARTASRWLAPGAAVGAAFGAGAFWSKWAAGIRSANHLSEAFQSEAQLRAWVFGSLADRLSPKTWLLIGGKDLILLFGPLGLGVPLLLVVAWWKGGAWANGRLRQMTLALAGYGIHVLAFPRLNLRHDYYMFGAGIYLLFATVCALAVCVELATSCWVRRLGLLLVFSMALGSPAYLLLKRGYHDFAADQAVAALNEVKAPGALLAFGLEWSPRVPFATGRKALMAAIDDPAAVTAAIAANRQTPFAAMVVLGTSNASVVQSAAESVGLDASRRVPFAPNGYLLLPPGSDLGVFPAVIASPQLAELRRRVPSDRPWRDGLIYRKISLGRGLDEGVVFIVKRGVDAFYLRVDRLQLFRVREYFDTP
jgi:hypothetical protein